MKTSRLVLCVNSIIVILVAMFYLSDIAMAQAPKERKPADKPPVPELDTFGDDGTPTFENTPTPTFQPPRQGNQDKVKEGKNKKGDDNLTIQSALPDLTVEGIIIQAAGSPPGTSVLPSELVRITVLVRNQGLAPASNVRVDVWKHRASALVTGPGDFVSTIPLLNPGDVSIIEHLFFVERQPDAYRAWATVDLFNEIVEQNETNETKNLQYYVVEVASLQTVPTNQPLLITPGDLIAFKATSSPANVDWPDSQPIITHPDGSGEITAVSSGGKGITNFTFASDVDFRGIATISVICGLTSAGDPISHKDVLVEVRDPSIIGPQTVPGGTQYRFDLLLHSLDNPQNIVWSTDTPSVATVVGVGKFANVAFKNTTPAVLRIKANYTVDGIPQLKELEVVVIQVFIGNGNFATLGQPSDADEGEGLSMRVRDNPPKTFVTSVDPGSVYREFIYKGNYGDPEGFFQTSSSSIPEISAFSVGTGVTLLAPAPIGGTNYGDRIGFIEIGFIQHMHMTSGLARYGSLSNLFRTATVPDTKGVDWAVHRPAEPPGPGESPRGKDYWPWYASVIDPTEVIPPAVHNPAGSTGVDTAGRPFWSGSLFLGDSPGADFPKFYTDGTTEIMSGRKITPFIVRVAVRTKDERNKAHKEFFGLREAKFTYDARYPAPPSGSPSQITKPNAWTVLGQGAPITVNATPGNILYFSPNRTFLQEGFLMWK